MVNNCFSRPGRGWCSWRGGPGTAGVWDQWPGSGTSSPRQRLGGAAVQIDNGMLSFRLDEQQLLKYENMFL